MDNTYLEESYGKLLTREDRIRLAYKKDFSRKVSPFSLVGEVPNSRETRLKEAYGINLKPIKL